MNLVPGRERHVSVADVEVPLTEPALSTLLVGREAYRRTRYLVARHGGRTAVLEVTTADREPLFSPIRGVRLLAGPDECAVVDDPAIDVAVPSQLAEAAHRAVGARAVVVYGRYGYVGFVVEPAPVHLRVVDVVPPVPAKLVDQVRRVLATSEDLPPVLLEPEVTDLAELARPAGPRSILFPCRVSGLTAPDASGTVSYLDERPPRRDWLLVGCARSAEIHRWFYGDDAPTIDFCPRRRLAPGDGATLVRCCQIEEGIAHDDGAVVVPWGASLAEVRSGLEAAVSPVVVP
jgi:hypothetical protein